VEFDRMVTRSGRTEGIQVELMLVQRIMLEGCAFCFFNEQKCWKEEGVVIKQQVLQSCFITTLVALLQQKLLLHFAHFLWYN